MTRLVFASCMHGLKDDRQIVWNEAIAHQPDWLVLCGDNIYMDYFPNINQSKHWDLSRFTEEMHTRYATQFLVPAFRNLIESIPEGQVIGVWDDHDFAWNNCYGADPDYGMEGKKKIATAFYHHYFDELNKRPLAKALPPLSVADIANAPNATKKIYRALDITPLRVLLCDGRSWRRQHTSGSTDGSVLGDEQEAWLFDELSYGSGPFLVVSGSTMTAGDDQSWDYFRDFYESRFLPAVRNKLVLFLAGDVHENRLPPRINDQPVEIVSSASVLTFPYNKRNFGVLDIQGSEASIFLFKRGNVEFTGQLDISTGTFATSMSVLAEEPEPSLSVDQATEQRRQAITQLKSL